MTDHLRGPVKGLSSYDKICGHLRETQNFHRYVEHVSRSLDEAKVAGWEFQPGGDEYASDPANRKYVASPTWCFIINWGQDYLSDGVLTQKVSAIDSAGIAQWEIWMENICSNAALDKIAEDNFNTLECPTYFCKLEKLLGRDKDGTRNHKLDHKWVIFARDAIKVSLAHKITSTQNRLRQEMLSALNSSEFEHERVTFHERGIADEIKKVLIKFSSVAKPHVLKMALDEFVTHEIMES
jgi:hypothetical protein